MQIYFAYGSNMSRLRLEERTREVIHHGRSSLTGYRHRFSHKGSDGSGKGNIEEAPGQVVHGVLYELSRQQVELLHPYEGGYQIIKVQVALASSGRELSAYTYTSRRTMTGLKPLASYLKYYMQGMSENSFPTAYIDSIQEQARQSVPTLQLGEDKNED